jgi:RNA polymerase sigma factor (sigma-70 family)
MSEEQNLIRASVAGDCRAFERLVEKYQSLICAITFSATGRVDTSEELAQETFLQAWKNLFQLKDIDKFRSWLCSIARNLIQTHYRQKHASKVAVCDTDTLEILAAQACPSSAEIAIGREEEMILSHALMQLPKNIGSRWCCFIGSINRQKKCTKSGYE